MWRAPRRELLAGGVPRIRATGGPMRANGAGRSALEITVHGVVQGVGFRPFVHRIAQRCGLSGWVANTRGSVAVHVEGDAPALARFRRLLKDERPAAARILRLSSRKAPVSGVRGFAIRESRTDGPALSTIPPDIATCPECLAELSDPANRRFRYAFTNCTNCGPRFTIVSSLPYDRERTSMAAFSMCRACRREYGDPRDRRFHAEPNACPECGPRLWLGDAAGAPVPSPDPVDSAAEALLRGDIVAIRGLGGFQLAVDATSDPAVRTLRKRKGREEKPFAVMFPDAASARAAARLGNADEAILRGPGAPILLLPAREPSPLARSVSMGLGTVGVFLPYTPLHRLLLTRTGRPLVMTSGNRTEEPIAVGNDEARQRLRGIADLFLTHDRDVLQRSDDSVVRRVGREIYPIRRARGFVPVPVALPRRFPDVVGLGGDLKSTFCFVRNDAAHVSQHLGDLEQVAARDFYRETFRFFREFLGARPRAACHDLHPAYFTTSFAEAAGADRLFALQHHKAHVYAVLAETGFSGKAVGVAFDGTGYGEDGAIWGGEFFAVDGAEVARTGHLAYFPLPGGDAAVRQPWRSALSLLREVFGRREAQERAAALFRDVPGDRVRLVLDALEKKVNVVPTSSVGRLFDAASAICGVCLRATFEGQAPMRLEGAARTRGSGTYPFTLSTEGGTLAVHWRGLVAGMADDAGRGVPTGVIARRFHDTLAAAIVAAVSRLAEECGARHAILSGGVFQNATLLAGVLAALRRKRMVPLIHRQVPANDGGISLGQAYYAALRVEGG